MIIAVINEEDKNKLLALKQKFICEQKSKNKVVYLFDINKTFLENTSIKYANFNKLCLTKGGDINE